MANHPKFSEVEGSIHKGINNLDKWYNKVNDTDAYFICLRAYPLTLYSPIKMYSLTFWFIVLDPNVKNAYALNKWDAESYAAGMSQLEKVVRAALSFQFESLWGIEWFFSQFDTYYYITPAQVLSVPAASSCTLE